MNKNPKLRARNGKTITHVVSVVRVVEPISYVRQDTRTVLGFEFDPGEAKTDWNYQQYIDKCYRDGSGEVIFIDEDGDEHIGKTLVACPVDVLDDDEFDGNDDHISALKEEVERLRALCIEHGVTP